MLFLWTLFLPIAFCNNVRIRLNDNGDLANQWMAQQLQTDHSSISRSFHSFTDYHWPGDTNQLQLSHGILEVGACTILIYPYYRINRYSLDRDKRFDSILLSTVELSRHGEIFVDNFKQCVQACLSVSGCRAVDLVTIDDMSNYQNKYMCHLHYYGLREGILKRDERQDYQVTKSSTHAAIEKCEYKASTPNGPGVQARWYKSKKTEPLRMKNGQATTAHSWPWIVDVAIFVNEWQPLKFCTGILIHPKYRPSNTHRVLTTASCLMNGRKRTIETQSGRQTLDITTGVPQQDSSILVIAGKQHSSDFEDNQQLRKSEKILIHPDFAINSESAIPEHDLAIIAVSPPFEYSDTVQSIGVSGKKKGFVTLFKGSKKKQCVSVGWCHEQASAAGMSRKFVQHMEFLMDQKECEQMWNYGQMRSDQQKSAILCSKSGQPKEPGCWGDEQSMLICQNKDEDRWMLEGVSTSTWKDSTQLFMSIITESDWITEASIY